MNKYKLINEKRNVGVWFTPVDLINLINICDKRSNEYKTKLIQAYEHLEGEKFDFELFHKKKKIFKN